MATNSYKLRPVKAMKLVIFATVEDVHVSSLHGQSLDGVRTNRVKKADAGTLDRCLRQLRISPVHKVAAISNHIHRPRCHI